MTTEVLVIAGSSFQRPRRLDDGLPFRDLAFHQSGFRLARAGTCDHALLFQGASSGVLGTEDLDEAARALEPGTSAGVLIYENVWAAPFATAVRRAGGQVAASGRIPVQELLAALDATGPAP